MIWNKSGYFGSIAAAFWLHSRIVKSELLRRGIREYIHERTAGTIHSAALGPAGGELHVADSPSGPEESLAARAERVAAVAAKHATAVDHDSRVPAEAIAAARAERLFGAAVPRELGGEGAEHRRHCRCLLHARPRLRLDRDDLRHASDQGGVHRAAWARQRLASAADAAACAASSCCWRRRPPRAIAAATCATARRRSRRTSRASRSNGMATVISYGEEADGIVTTARRSPDAASGDQVLVAFLKDDYTLERLIGWDALGMRGTCSAGFKLVAAGASEQILPASYDEIHAQTMMPVAHLTWSGAWAGIAAAAVDRARAFVRKAAHRAGWRRMPPGAAHLTRASASLRTLRSLIAGALQRFELAADDPVALESVDFQTGMNLLKVNASELAVATVMSAMQACGLSGYRNDGDFSIGRHLRDVLSSPIMISNDRILANVGTASLLSGAPASLRERV